MHCDCIHMCGCNKYAPIKKKILLLLAQHLREAEQWSSRPGSKRSAAPQPIRIFLLGSNPSSPLLAAWCWMGYMASLPFTFPMCKED